MSTSCILIGAGGHAAVLIDALLESGVVPAGALSADEHAWGSEIMGVPVLGGDDQLSGNACQNAGHFIIAFGATHRWAERNAAFRQAVDSGLKPLSVIHPTAAVSRFAEIGPGSAVLAQAAVNPRAVIGENSAVNTAAVVEHDCRLGANVHVAPGAVLCGGVVVGDHAYIGANAVVHPGLTLGEGCIIGAGANVLTDVDPHATVVGNPAK